MSKRYLFTPGPVPIPEEVLLTMAKQVIHHRASAFVQIFQEVRENLKWLFGTKSEVLTLASTGTGAMEAAVVNLLSPGDIAIAVNGGKFGERWAQLCRTYGVNVEEIVVPWGEAVKPGQVKSALEAHPEAKAVFIQASETSTGVKHPVKEIAEFTSARPNTVLAADAITALAVFELPMDEWGIDVVVGGSQKALILPPGLAFIALSDKAQAFTANSKCPKYYFDLKKERKNQLSNQTAYTSAVTHIVALGEVLRRFKSTGLEKIYAKNALLFRAVMAGGVALGIKPFAKESPSEAVAAFWAPEGIDGGELKNRMDKHYKVTIAGGQDAYKGKMFRIGLLGDVDHFDAVVAMSALEMALADLGYKYTPGAGVAATLAVLREGWQ